MIAIICNGPIIKYGKCKNIESILDASLLNKFNNRPEAFEFNLFEVSLNDLILNFNMKCFHILRKY